MPSVPWPRAESEIDLIASALKHNVAESDIRFVAGTPRHRLRRIEPGQKHSRLDSLYQSRSTLAIGYTHSRRSLEIALRQDGRIRDRDVWIVFHARYT